jgi:hypothetical protein
MYSLRLYSYHFTLLYKHTIHCHILDLRSYERMRGRVWCFEHIFISSSHHHAQRCAQTKSSTMCVSKTYIYSMILTRFSLMMMVRHSVASSISCADRFRVTVRPHRRTHLDTHTRVHSSTHDSVTDEHAATETASILAASAQPHRTPSASGAPLPRDRDRKQCSAVSTSLLPVSHLLPRYGIRAPQ